MRPIKESELSECALVVLRRYDEELEKLKTGRKEFLEKTLDSIVRPEDKAPGNVVYCSNNGQEIGVVTAKNPKFDGDESSIGVTIFKNRP